MEHFYSPDHWIDLMKCFSEPTKNEDTMHDRLTSSTDACAGVGRKLVEVGCLFVRYVCVSYAVSIPCYAKRSVDDKQNYFTTWFRVNQHAPLEPIYPRVNEECLPSGRLSFCLWITLTCYVALTIYVILRCASKLQGCNAPFQCAGVTFIFIGIKTFFPAIHLILRVVVVYSFTAQPQLQLQCVGFVFVWGSASGFVLVVCFFGLSFRSVCFTHQITGNYPY